jgi:hypothetical protein
VVISKRWARTEDGTGNGRQVQILNRTGSAVTVTVETEQDTAMDEAGEGDDEGQNRGGGNEGAKDPRGDLIDTEMIFTTTHPEIEGV